MLPCWRLLLNRGMWGDGCKGGMRWPGRSRIVEVAGNVDREGREPRRSGVGMDGRMDPVDPVGQKRRCWEIGMVGIGVGMMVLVRAVEVLDGSGTQVVSMVVEDSDKEDTVVVKVVL